MKVFLVLLLQCFTTFSSTGSRHDEEKTSTKEQLQHNNVEKQFVHKTILDKQVEFVLHTLSEKISCLYKLDRRHSLTDF